MPTLAAAGNAKCPPTDGLSFLPTLTGNGNQASHNYLYWEYLGQTAVRKENWKAYKKQRGKWQLYNLAKDPEEKMDVSNGHPTLLKELVTLAETSHKPIHRGEIYDQRLVTKDHIQAPHERNLNQLRKQQ